MAVTDLPTLPGEFVCSGCEQCNPAMFSNAGGRLHEGHFSVGLGDQLCEVFIDGGKATGIREVIIDRDTLCDECEEQYMADRAAQERQEIGTMQKRTLE